MLVVDLSGTRKYDRACEHGSNLHLVLVCKTSEEFFEGEELVAGVPYTCRIRLIVVCLREGPFLELGVALQGKSRKEQNACCNISEESFH